MKAEMLDDSRPLTNFFSLIMCCLQLLMAYMTNPRQESPLDDDESQALEDARLLYRASEGRIGTDEADIIHVFSSRTARQLNAAFCRYWDRYHQDIEKVRKSIQILSYFFLC